MVEESKKINEKLTALENKIKDKEAQVSVLTEYINTLISYASKGYEHRLHTDLDK